MLLWEATMLLAGVVRSSSASATSSGSNPENLASSGESLASGSSKSPTVSPHAVAKSLLCPWSQLKFFFCISQLHSGDVAALLLGIFCVAPLGNGS